MMRARIVRQLRVVSWIVVAAGVTASGQNRDTLETKVTAESGAIVLEWSKKHPWDTELRTRGASLVAEYRTRARGLVSEVIRTATSRGRGERTIRFQLPDASTSVPLGAICLYVQLPTQKLLPVRRATDRGGETARFRYEAWDREASKRTAAEVLRASAALTKRQLAANEQDIAAQERLAARGGGTSFDACEAIPMPAGHVERPFDVLQPTAHDDVARQVCVLRALNGQSTNDFAVVRSAALLEELLQRLPAEQLSVDPNLVARRKELAEFQRDWNRWEPQVSAYRNAYPRPHFGQHTDTLDLQTSTANAARALAANRVPDLSDIPGYVGGALEAYSRCVEDGKKQLRTKYESWQSLASTSPIRTELARQQLVNACRREVIKLDQLKSDNLALRRQLESDEAALREAIVVTPVGGKSQPLNNVSCSVQ